MSPNPESLSDKLKSLGVQVGAQHIKLPVARHPFKLQHEIESVVEGYDLPTQYGNSFISEQLFLNNHQHGCLPLCTQTGLDVIAAWGHTPQLEDPALQNVVFLDTETSGLMGGTGTYAFLVGIGYHSADGFRLVQFFMRDPGHETALLAALQQWLSPFNVVVTFNGKTFDLPLLNTRYTINSMDTPFQGFDHLDVLHVARKLWRDRLPSRALGYLEQEIAQFSRTGEEVPGWMVPQLYFDYLRSGDARPLGGVFYHNAMDILSLAAIFNHVAGLVKEPVRFAQGSGLDIAAIARMYEELGWLEQAADLYEASLEKGLPEPFYIKTLDRFALLRRKQGDWEKATVLWKKAAERGQYLPCVELAKYYEHHTRNYPEAIKWTQRALGLLDHFFQYESTRRPVELDLQQRANRLLRKLNGSGMG
jgi:hypothetical protein